MGNRLQNNFDLAVKQAKGGHLSEGYVTTEGNLYTAYCTNQKWDDFLEDMKSNHKDAYCEFSKGNGAELSGKKNRYGNIVPPKMASYASSSRFIYELSKDIPGFAFECKLHTSFGAAKASLDGYIKNKCLFVEAKCHEIYSGMSSPYKRAYETFYEYIKGKTDLDYIITTGRNKVNEYVRFKWNGEELKTLDFKQLLCHMLGIANLALQEWEKCRKTSTLIYLVYNPDEILDLLTTERDRRHILEKWNNEKEEAQSVDFKQLYNHIVHYLSKKCPGICSNSSTVEDVAKAFEFRFCDQHDYIDVINSVK